MGDTKEVLLQLKFSLENTKPAFRSKSWKNENIRIMNKLKQFSINESNWSEKWKSIYKDTSIRNVSTGPKTTQKKRGGD